MIYYVLWIIVVADPGGYTLREDIINPKPMTIAECVDSQAFWSAKPQRENEIATYECREVVEQEPERESD